MSQTDDALVRAIEDEPDAESATALCHRALQRLGLAAGWNSLTLRLPAELSAAQRRLSEVIVARDLASGGWGMPSTRRLQRRWAGLAPPGIWEQEAALERDGRAVRWPVWRAVQDARTPVSLHALGVRWSPQEQWVAVADLALDGYGEARPADLRPFDELTAVAPAMLEWARGFVVELAQVYPESHRPARFGPALLGPGLCALTFLPFLRAGEPIDPAHDHLLTFEMSRDLARELAAALPRERAERVACDNSMWPPQVINGLDSLMNIVDLVPTRRVAERVVLKLRNKLNASFLKRSGPAYRAQLAALAAREPEVREALAPRRGGQARAGARR